MSDHVLVVTGSGGIGFACARRMGSGAKVVLADFDKGTLEAAASKLKVEGYDVTAVQLDVSSGDDVARLADVAAALGTIRAVVHTAGLSPSQASSARIYEVNLLGTALMIERFAEFSGMAAVMISSCARFVVHPEPGMSARLARAYAQDLPSLIDQELTQLPWNDPFAAYCLSKACNFDRVQAAATAYGSVGSRINSISPGNILTPMIRREEGNLKSIGPMLKITPMGGMGRPEDIAMAAEFLCSRQASYITGSDLVVDGGVTAAMAYDDDFAVPSVK